MAKSDPPKKKNPLQVILDAPEAFNEWYSNIPVGPITQKVRDKYNENPQKGLKESWPGIVKNVRNVYYHADQYLGGLLPGGAPPFMGKIVRDAWKKQDKMWQEQDRQHLEFNKDIIEHVRKQQDGS
mgnify:CR=1 FL=1|tara:strand:- start:4466 stop:4843 length:378 start_codon:yes stop_codon:yes gene_type:complete